MKLQTVLIALLYGLTTLILLPRLFIWLNTQLSLPTYSFLVMKIIGAVIIFLGGIVWLHSIMLFIFTGQGTPVPTQSPKKFVEKGAYKYTRNPMYICVLIILFGYFLIFGQILLLANLILMAVFFHLFVVFYEEPILKKKFGNEYLEYCKKVPRWL